VDPLYVLEGNALEEAGQGCPLTTSNQFRDSFENFDSQKELKEPISVKDSIKTWEGRNDKLFVCYCCLLEAKGGLLHCCKKIAFFWANGLAYDHGLFEA